MSFILFLSSLSEALQRYEAKLLFLSMKSVGSEHGNATAVSFHNVVRHLQSEPVSGTNKHFMRTYTDSVQLPRGIMLQPVLLLLVALSLKTGPIKKKKNLISPLDTKHRNIWSMLK